MIAPIGYWIYATIDSIRLALKRRAAMSRALDEADRDRIAYQHLLGDATRRAQDLEGERDALETELRLVIAENHRLESDLERARSRPTQSRQTAAAG